MNFKEQVDAYIASGKKVLNLIIKQQYYDEILAGTKKQEFREIKPSTEKKYILLDKEGYAAEDENGNSIPIHYDALLLYVGYKPDREAMLIECTGASTQVLVDENDEPLFFFIDKNTRKEVFPRYYDPDTFEALDEKNNVIENYEVYYSEQITYDLGKIIAKKLNR